MEIEYDPYEMNGEIYEMIKLYIANGFTEDEINQLIPGKPNLYSHYIAFSDSYEKKKDEEFKKWAEQEKGLMKVLNFEEGRIKAKVTNEKKKRKKEIKNKRITKKLTNKLNDIKDFRKMKQLIKSTRIGGKKKGSDINPEYKEEFEFLDSQIEKIEDLIVLCVTPLRIIAELNKVWKREVRPTIFFKWIEESKYIKRLKEAERHSAEVQISLGKEFMLSWLNNPELNMQHVGIVREIGLWHSRQAGFLNRRKWGNKVEVVDDRPQQKIISGKDINMFLEGLTNAAKNREEEESADESEGENQGEFSDYEEVKE